MIEEIKRNNTTLFLASMCEIGEFELESMGLKECYLGDHAFDNDYKNCLFLLYNTDERSEHYLKHVLRSRPLYVVDYSVDEYSYMVVMRIPSMYHESVKYFKQGKYSKMDANYMETTFKKTDERYLAYIRHPDFKRHREERIGVTIDDNQDLWTKPQPEREIFRYNEEVYKNKGW